MARRQETMAMPSRDQLEAAWLRLTRDELPHVAVERRWPVSRDHCFQRILLDNAVGGCWYDHIRDRPAYAHAPGETLTQAVALGEAVLRGDADLAALNRRSLAWRRARKQPT
jgi:hypothetical protein